MLWVRSDLDAEQLPVPSADLTAAVLQLPDRTVMVVSVYVEGQNAAALAYTIEQLRSLIERFRSGRGTRTDVILAGDFNQHDQLWGGDDVSPTRQGEADPLVDFMSEYSLRSLLPRA
jgi:Endonuclease-reverse transcriptase